MNGGAGRAVARPGGGGGTKGGGGGARQQGRIKFFDQDKGFGFIAPAGGGEDVFLHSREIAGSTAGLDEGAEVSFELRKDRSGRTAAAAAELLNPPAVAEGMIRLPCFSMSQPFASLLMYGQKTIETRNNPMFEGVTGRVAVHVGRRPWKDKEYFNRLQEAGLSPSSIKHLCTLPEGFAVRRPARPPRPRHRGAASPPSPSTPPPPACSQGT
jgi:CspA family cold shock protein